MIRRHAEEIVRRALRDMPVVLLHGARQTGKTTLAKSIAASKAGMRYLTLDDAATLAAARADPVGFVEGVGNAVVIDEVQQAPELFPAIKSSVDRQRKPGRFLLTGSTSVLLLPRLSESLAGRMEIVTLWPFSQGEIAGSHERFVTSMFARSMPEAADYRSERPDLIGRALRGGYPVAYGRSEERRRDWFAAYITTILQRDVRDLADIEGLSTLPRLLSLIAGRAGSLLNVSDLSRSSGIPLSTLQRYMTLLEAVFLVGRIPAWSSNRAKRLIKTPKVSIVDTGLMAHLVGLTSIRLAREPTLAGSLLESFVATELNKQLSWGQRAELFHFRTHGGREVDLVLEADDGRIVGIEVKASATIDSRDAAGLRTLAEEAGNRFHRGVLLYAGSEMLPFGPGLHALPMSSLWQLSSKVPGTD